MNEQRPSEALISTFVEVKLKTPSDFLKVAETLTRIGIPKLSEGKLFQSCLILHKLGKYYIVHFKEMLALDGLETNYSDEDRRRRNKIAALLEEWGLVDIIDHSKIEDQADISTIKVISYSEKKNWILRTKYRIGHN